MKNGAIERNEKREWKNQRVVDWGAGGAWVANYLVLIKLLPDADVRGRTDYAVAD